MVRLPLYAGPLPAAVEKEPPLAVDRACTRCELHDRKGVKVCIPPEGSPGGLLVVGEAPGRDENRAGRPFVGQSGKLLRAQLARYWRGPVALANAVGCFPGRDGPDDDAIAACRGYLSKTLQDVKPERVLALGGVSSRSLLGRSVMMLSSRRGYAYLPDTMAPVFFVLHPAAALRNRFIRKWFDADIEWALTCDLPPPPDHAAPVLLVETAADSVAACTELYALADARGARLSWDCETAGAMYGSDYRLLSVAVHAQGSRHVYVWTNQILQDLEACQDLIHLFADANVGKVGHNAKYDVQAMQTWSGVPVRGVVADTRLWRKLLFGDADGKLERMAELVGWGSYKNEMHTVRAKAIRMARKGKFYGDAILANDAALLGRMDGGADPKIYSFGLVPADQTYRYNAADALVTNSLADLLEPQLRAEPDLQRTWDQIVRRAADAVTQIEQWGIMADKQRIADFRVKVRASVNDSLSFFKQYGSDFNPNSTRQVAKLFFSDLGLKVQSVTDSGAPSTNKDSLKMLQGQHPAVDALLTLRTNSKLLGTYADPLIDYVRMDGRIHPNLKLDGTRSGRPSCDSPNLLNIPRAETEMGKMARDCYTAPDGFLLLQADFSQLELRVAAILSGDPLMKQIFVAGDDYHKRTAEMVSKMVWGIPPDQVEKKHRTAAKTLNFSLMYGAGDDSVAQKLGISKQQVSRLRKAVLGNFRMLSKYFEEQTAQARRHGEVWTWWNGHRSRRRSMWRIADQDDYARSQAENAAGNTPIQGTASEFCVASLVELTEWIQRERLEDRVKIVLTVYDSIMFEVREDMVDLVARKAKDVMTGWPSSGVPLEVDLEKGKHWGSIEKFILS